MQLVDANQVGMEVNTFFLNYPGYDGTTWFVLGICDTGQRVNQTGQGQMSEEQEHDGDDPQGPGQCGEGEGHHDNPDDLSQTISLKMQDELNKCGTPGEGDLHVYFSSWRVMMAGKTSANLNFADMDLLQDKSVVKHLFELKSHKTWMLDFLREILGAAADTALEAANVIKFHMALSGVYSSRAENHRDHPPIAVNNIRCMNCMSSEEEAHSATFNKLEL